MIRLAAASLFLAVTAAQAPSALAADGAEYRGGCIKGKGSLRSGCVMGHRLMLATPDGARATQARWVYREDSKGQNPGVGLATETGEWIIKPVYERLYPSSTHAGLGRIKGQLVQATAAGPGAPVPTELGTHIEVLGLPTTYATDESNPRAVFVSTASTDRVKRDLTWVGPDGALGGTIKDVLPLWQGGVQRVGANYVLTVEDAGGQRGSVFTDALGKPFFVSPEVKTFKVQPFRRGREECGVARPSDAAGIVIGPAPSSVKINGATLYHPLDERGRPMVLPAGVRGVVPIVYSETAGSAAYSHIPPGRCISGWIIVMDGELRVARGGLTLRPADMDLLAPLDEVGLAHKDPPSFAPSPWSGDDMYGVVLAKAKGQEAWLASAILNPQLAPYDKPWGRTRTAALDSYHAEETLGRIISAASTKAGAAAGAELARQEKGEALALLARGGGLSPEEMGRVNTLTRKWKGEVRDAFYKRFPPPRDQTPLLCAEQGLFCDTARIYREEGLAQWRRDQAQRDAWASALRNLAKVPTNPDVRVSIYENGQFRSEVMPLEHFNNIYR